MNRKIITCLLVLLPIICNGASVPPQCEQKISSFITLLNSGAFKEAAIFLWSGKKWSSPDDTEKMTDTLKSFTEDEIGKYLGYENIYNDSISKDCITIVTMLKYERQPIFMRFVFYRPSQTFLIGKVDINTDVDEVRKKWLIINENIITEKPSLIP
jgi:hypothetical protein